MRRAAGDTATSPPQHRDAALAIPLQLHELAVMFRRGVAAPQRSLAAAGGMGTVSPRRRRAGRPKPGAARRRGSASRAWGCRSEEHTSELQSLMRISYAVFCLKKKKNHTHNQSHNKLQIYTQLV